MKTRMLRDIQHCPVPQKLVDGKNRTSNIDRNMILPNIKNLGTWCIILTVLQAGATANARDDAGKPTPQMQAVLDALAKLGPKPIESLPPAVARAQPSVADAAIQVVQDQGTVAPDRLPSVGKVEMMALPGPDGNAIPVRVYSPKGAGPFPMIVYYHGGGWVLASLDTYDASCRSLSSLCEAVVISVDYRLAPEHKFPAAIEDCYAALQYVFAHADQFSGDDKRVAVAGESAGGNLATVVCLMAGQRGGRMPVHQALIYPITDYHFDTASYQQNASAKPLNAAMMHWFFQQYLGSPTDGGKIFVSPIRATRDELHSLPPATIITAELDPLRNDGMGYAERLKVAGVDVAFKDFTGVTHEFFGMSLLVDQAKAANAFVTGRLKSTFAAK